MCSNYLGAKFETIIHNQQKYEFPPSFQAKKQNFESFKLVFVACMVTEVALKINYNVRDL